MESGNRWWNDLWVTIYRKGIRWKIGEQEKYTRSGENFHTQLLTPIRIPNIRFATNKNSESRYNFVQIGRARGGGFIVFDGQLWCARPWSYMVRDWIAWDPGPARRKAGVMMRGYGGRYYLLWHDIWSRVWRIWRIGIWPMKRRMADEMRSGIFVLSLDCWLAGVSDTQ